MSVAQHHQDPCTDLSWVIDGQHVSKGSGRHPAFPTAGHPRGNRHAGLTAWSLSLKPGDRPQPCFPPPTAAKRPELSQ